MIIIIINFIFNLDLGQGGVAGVILHAREVKLIDPEQQGALKRITLQDFRSCHELDISY